MFQVEVCGDVTGDVSGDVCDMDFILFSLMLCPFLSFDPGVHADLSRDALS